MDKLCACGGKLLPRLRICYRCWQKEQKVKRDKKKDRQARTLALIKKREKRKDRVEKHLNSYKYLMKKAWDLQSLVMRKSAADADGRVRCFTCDKIMRWQDSMVGHFYHGKFDFDPRNLRIQGACCNTYRHGNLAVYSTKLVEEGINLKQLRRDAEIKGNAYTTIELKELIANFTKKLEELNKKTAN